MSDFKVEIKTSEVFPEVKKYTRKIKFFEKLDNNIFQYRNIMLNLNRTELIESLYEKIGSY